MVKENVTIQNNQHIPNNCTLLEHISRALQINLRTLINYFKRPPIIQVSQWCSYTFLKHKQQHQQHEHSEEHLHHSWPSKRVRENWFQSSGLPLSAKHCHNQPQHPAEEKGWTGEKLIFRHIRTIMACGMCVYPSFPSSTTISSGTGSSKMAAAGLCDRYYYCFFSSYGSMLREAIKWFVCASFEPKRPEIIRYGVISRSNTAEPLQLSWVIRWCFATQCKPW